MQYPTKMVKAKRIKNVLEWFWCSDAVFGLVVLVAAVSRWHVRNPLIQAGRRHKCTASFAKRLFSINKIYDYFSCRKSFQSRLRKEFCHEKVFYRLLDD